MSVSRKFFSAGFTLIELLVVIAIIGLLASVVLASLSNAKESGNNAKRVSSAKEIQNALEVYYLKNNAYPTTSGNWYTACTVSGTTKTANWIPGLATTYIGSLPSDPDQESAAVGGAGKCCYLYRSNGADFKLMFGYTCQAVISNTKYGESRAFIDPNRDGGSNSSLQDWNGTYALSDWAIYTPGAAAW